jgi:putative spermidine/putrescine transport system substrate-binding protein
MSRESPHRRQFLGQAASAGLTAGLVLTGCGRDAPPRKGDFRGQKLRIFVYAGAHADTMRQVFVPRFEQETGATVILDAGWWDSIAKLKASPKGQPAYDLVITDATQGYPAIKDGLFQKLDLAKVPNRNNLNPAVLDNWVYKEGYGITFPNSVMTLAYHKKLTPFEPARWSDLLRPEVKGKVGLYDSFYMSLYTFACMKVDMEGKAGTAAAELERDLEGVLAFARERREQVKFWWPTSTDMILSLTRENCALGNMHSPEMLKALRERLELQAVIPEKDRAFVQVFWVVPDGTPRKDLAEKAIDLIFSEEMQLGFARTGSATAVLPVAQQMAREDPFWRQIYPSTEEQLRTLQYYPYDVYFASWKHIAEVWDQQILRKG